MIGVLRKFRFTLAALVLLPLGLWQIKHRLGPLLVPEIYEPDRFSPPGSPDEVHFALVRLASLLLVVPILAAEVWLLICERVNADSARRYTIPFALSSGAAQLAALALVHYIDPASFVQFVLTGS